MRICVSECVCVCVCVSVCVPWCLRRHSLSGRVCARPSCPVSPTDLAPSSSPGGAGRCGRGVAPAVTLETCTPAQRQRASPDRWTPARRHRTTSGPRPSLTHTHTHTHTHRRTHTFNIQTLDYTHNTQQTHSLRNRQTRGDNSFTQHSQKLPPHTHFTQVRQIEGTHTQSRGSEQSNRFGRTK